MFVLTVEITVKPGELERFLPLMEENARASLATEPGCHQFDIVQSTDTPHEILLYEVYDDEAAFQHHVTTSHYNAFNEAAGALMASKTARVFKRLVP